MLRFNAWSMRYFMMRLSIYMLIRRICYSGIIGSMNFYGNHHDRVSDKCMFMYSYASANFMRSICTYVCMWSSWHPDLGATVVASGLGCYIPCSDTTKCNTLTRTLPIAASRLKCHSTWRTKTCLKDLDCQHAATFFSQLKPYINITS